MSNSPEFMISLSHNQTHENHVTLAFTLGLKSLEKGHGIAIPPLWGGGDIRAPFLPAIDMLISAKSTLQLN